MIELNNISFSYGSKNDVLKEVSLKVNDGEFIGLIGNNGAGKTTLLKIMMNLLKPIDGEVKDTFARRSFLSQVTNTNDMFFPATVKEVVSLGLKYKPFSFMTPSDWKKVDDSLQIMGVLDLKNRSMNELSGGQQQRVRLAKALVSNPELLVLDEPTAGMDTISREMFLNEVNKLNKECKVTIVLVTHFASDLKDTDRIYELINGRIKVVEKGEKVKI